MRPPAAALTALFLALGEMSSTQADVGWMAEHRREDQERVVTFVPNVDLIGFAGPA